MYEVQGSKRTSIKHQLLLYLGVLMITLAVADYIFSLIVVVVVTGSINSYAEDYVADQISRHSQVLLSQNSKLIVNYLSSYANGIIKPVAYAEENVLRSGFIPITNSADNYFDWDASTLKSPVLYNSRVLRDCSLTASSYYLPGVFLTDLPNLPASTQTEISRSNYLDIYFISLYPNYLDLSRGFATFDDSGLVRRYPGIYTDQSDRSYDPRVRDWYVLAKSDQSDAVISNPYLDSQGLGLQITISKAFRDQSNNFIGVVGGNLLLATLVETIEKVNLYKTGNLILIQVDKTVIVNKDEDTSFLNLLDLTIPPGRPLTVSEGEYTYIYEKIPDFGEIYVLIAKFKAEEIQAPLAEVRDKMTTTKIALILILLAIFLGIVVFTIFLLIFLVRGIVKPIEEIVSISDGIVNEIGRGPAKKKAVGSDQKKVNVAEILEVGALRNKIDDFKSELDKNKEIQTQKMYVKNKYYDKAAAGEAPWAV